LDRIQVFDGESPHAEEVVGLIDVHSPAGEDEAIALQVLKAKAAALDADAIVNVEFHHAETEGAPNHLSGTAVRYRDLLNGHKYEVLEQLQVVEPMGNETAAFAQLREKAGAIGADLVLNIHFEHGEANSPAVSVTGEAVHILE
jgi:uncharacterized protein YbjQ (UPF0145 family)